MSSDQTKTVHPSDAADTTTEPTTRPVVPSPEPAQLPLDRVMRSIRDDSQQDSDEYQRQSKIPGGGE